MLLAGAARILGVSPPLGCHGLSCERGMAGAA
jgi:hypothetical protein